ncbi:MAG: ABC transporter permease [Candidatus Saganbacteria bacterium]|nr:ABC transporter permease [Candidatus Saganbacteria bacterium]
MFSLRRLLAVAKKEFLEIKRNLLLFLVLTLGPVMLYLLNAYGLPIDIKNIPLGILDMDKSALSRSLEDTFENSKIFTIKQNVRDINTLKKKLSLSELRAGIIIPTNFGAELARNSPVTIQALVDGSYPNHALISAGYIEAAVGFFNFDLLDRYFHRFWGTSANIPIPIDIKSSVWYNPTFNSNYFMLPGLFGLTLVFFPAVMAALSLTKEKETRSILNFYCSNVTKAEYLIGKMLPYVIITFIQCLICFSHAVFLMDVPMRGSLLAFIIASFLFSAVSVGIGLLIAVFIHTQAAAILITTIITLTLTFTYSGIITPVICLSEENRVISNLLPITHFIDVTRKVMIRGASFGQVENSIMILAVSCIVFYGSAILFFKKRLG